MSRQIKGLLYFFIMDLRYSMIVFWTILLSILFFFMILYYYVIGVENSEFSFGLPFAAYVYCGVLGFLAVKENIPFSLKMGATRKNFFLANGLFFLGISLFFAIAASTIQSVVTFLFSDTSMQSFQFLHLASGRTASVICERLTISLNTVRYHSKNIYVKLGVHSQQELIDLVEQTHRKQEGQR